MFNHITINDTKKILIFALIIYFSSIWTIEYIQIKKYKFKNNLKMIDSIAFAEIS